MIAAPSVSLASARYSVCNTARVASDMPRPNAVGSFYDPRGGRVTLVRTATAGHEVHDDLRPATLEEVVLGYLASARTPPVAAHHAAS